MLKMIFRNKWVVIIIFSVVGSLWTALSFTRQALALQKAENANVRASLEAMAESQEAFMLSAQLAASNAREKVIIREVQTQKQTVVNDVVGECIDHPVPDDIKRVFTATGQGTGGIPTAFDTGEFVRRFFDKPTTN